MYLFNTQRPVRLEEIQTLSVLNAPLSEEQSTLLANQTDKPPVCSASY
jgi:hypothetical protein